MIFMWLGPFVACVIALWWFGVSISDVSGRLQERFLNMQDPSSTIKTMYTTKFCGLGMGSFVRTQYSAVALLNTRAFSRRHGILLLCLSSAGTWATMFAILCAWQFDGSLLVAPWVLLYLFAQWTGKSIQWFRPLLAFGALMSLLQWALSKQSILMTTLGESDLHFMLADGRLPAQLLWIAVSFVVTLLVGVESWAVLLALLMVVAGSMSLNGAVAFIVGEMLGHVWLLWWRSRKLNQDVKALTKSYAWVSTVGLVIAFFAAGMLREIFAWSFMFEAGQLTEKSLQILSLYFVIVAIQALAVLTWGHFASQKKIDEVQKGEYFPIRWIKFGMISNDVLDFILKKLSVRLELLLAQKKELDSKDRAQIPANFLSEHENEITQLAMWLPVAADERQKHDRNL